MSPVLGTQLIHRCHERIELYTLTRVWKAPVRSSVPRTLESTFPQCAPAGDAWESTEALADSKDCVLFSIMKSAVVYNSISRAIRVSVWFMQTLPKCAWEGFGRNMKDQKADTAANAGAVSTSMTGLLDWLRVLSFFVLFSLWRSDSFCFPEWGQYFLNDPIHIPLSPFHS